MTSTQHDPHINTELATTMITTVTVETVHGLKDTIVVGTSGVGGIVDTTLPQVKQAKCANLAAPPASQADTAEGRPSAK